MRPTAPPADVPEPGMLESLRGAAEEVVAKCTAELALVPSSQRTARLHYQIAQACEGVLGDFVAADTHYQRALAEAPDHVPTIRGARRAVIQLGRFAEALPLFDAELRVTADPKAKALLLYQKGRFLEETLGESEAARSAYGDALELDLANPTVLKAVERCDRAAGQWRSLARIYERAADAVKGDASHRAALLVKRAQLLETALDDPAAAAEVYALALQLEAGVEEALEALVRICAGRRDWTALIALLARSADRSDDARERTLALYRMARLHVDRLGNRQDAVAALASAVVASPGEPLLLEELTRLQRQGGDHEGLAVSLRQLVAATPEVADRLALLHTLGEVHEKALGREEEAIGCYRDALAIDPTHVPTLQALGKLLTRRQDWQRLVEMHLAEAATSESSARRAAAHARAAEIYETHLQRAAEAAEHHARALALVPGYPASFKALVRLYGQARKHRELVELYERAVDEAATIERKVTYLFNVGTLWEDALGDAVEAAHAYRRILKLQRDSLGALHALQRVAEKAERYTELVEWLEREAELTSETELVVGLLHRAGTILDDHLDDPQGAKQRFLRALELEPSFVPALSGLGRLHYRAGHWDELLEMYRRELDATPDGRARVALLTKMGELCERQRGKPAEAIAWYREAVELAAGHRPAVRALERLLREAGEHGDLARLLERHVAEVQDPATRALTFFRIGELYEERLDGPTEALAFYRKALGEVPGHPAAAAALERLLEAAGEWDQLLEHLAASAETGDPGRKAALFLRQGEILRQHLDDHARAIERFEAVLTHERSLAALLALEPLYAEAGDWGALASVYDRQAEAFHDPAAQLGALREVVRLQESKGVGLPSDRATTYEAILALAPGDAEALNGLADVARRTSDSHMLARIYARLGEAEPDDSVASEHWLRLGHVLEAIEAPGALEAYRAALRKAPESLSAVRGLARLAQASGDTDTLVEATRREARLTVDPAEAAALLVRSATLALEGQGDRQGIAEDLTRALETWPDDAQAPELLARLLVEEGRADRLADLLSRAADSARRPERQAALWLAVATVQAAQLHNGGAAVAALRRALRVLPGHVEAHRALVGVYLANHQWPEAVAALEALVPHEVDQAERAAIHVRIGDLLDERLSEPDRARAAFTAALELAPGNPAALARLARSQLRAGEVGVAETTIRLLLEHASEDADRASALVLSAMLERARGNRAAAERALCEAVAIEGALGQAAALFPKMAAGGASWVALVAALEAHIQRCGPLEGRVASWLALATTYADRMSLPRKAFEPLAEGLHATGGDGRLIDELITRARATGQLEEAARLLRGLLERQERQSELWRSLGRLYREMERPLEARLAANAVVALGVATAEERDALRLSPPRPGRAMPGALAPDQAAELSVDGATAGPAAALIAACAESLGKIAPTDPDTYGISRRDRLAPGANHPLREQVDRLSRVTGLECELYQHPKSAPLVTVGLAEPLYLIVSARLATLPEAQQVFLLSRTLLAVALNLHPVILFSIPDLNRLLVAGTRVILPEFGGDDPHVEDLARRIKKAISRRARKALESAAPAYAAAPVTSVQGWQQAVVRSLSRAAALLGDDVAAALAALSLTEDPGRAGAPIEESSDLLRFWMSDPAARFRARAAAAGTSD